MKRANDIVVPVRSERRFYGHGIPGVKLEELGGKLIVVEGADGSGRSTQIAKLVAWLEGSGHATVQVGLKRSRDRIPPRISRGSNPSTSTFRKSRR